MNQTDSSPKGERTPADLVALIVSTFFGSGFFPIAPATFASAILTGILYFIGPGKPPLLTLSAIIIGVTLLGFWSATETEKRHGHDARIIVIDEIAGMLLTVLFVPWDLPHLAAGFILFRIMDIAKPPPVGKLEALPKGVGIVMDDMGAGLYALLVLALGERLLSLF